MNNNETNKTNKTNENKNTNINITFFHMLVYV